MLGALIGEEIIGRAIALIIWMPLVGQMPALRKADWILASVNALSHALLNIGQKKLFVIEIVPALSFIIVSSSIE